MASELDVATCNGHLHCGAKDVANIKAAFFRGALFLANMTVALFRGALFEFAALRVKLWLLELWLWPAQGGHCTVELRIKMAFLRGALSEFGALQL